MPITTIINNKLYVQLDSWVKEGMITVTNEQKRSTTVRIKDSNFEMIDLPENSHLLQIVIKAESETITKKIRLWDI